MTHTALPWEIDGIGLSGGGTFVCFMGEPAQFAGDSPRMLPNHEANAELIVRAVNSHDDLVKALDGMLLHFARKAGSQFQHDAVRKARAAAAKARGEQGS